MLGQVHMGLPRNTAQCRACSGFYPKIQVIQSTGFLQFHGLETNSINYVINVLTILDEVHVKSVCSACV